MTFQNIDSRKNPTKPTIQTLENVSTNLPPKIVTLIRNYPTVFQGPHGLPLSRPHGHHIPLFANTTSINVKSYLYPYSQKYVVTSIILEMLRDGTIILNITPFSSLVQLVKKDRTWRLCVDHMVLNIISIKDRFLITMIDKLLDEFGSTTIFIKIDLHSNYNQIKVDFEDTHKTAFRTFVSHYEFLKMTFGLKSAPLTFQMCHE